MAYPNRYEIEIGSPIGPKTSGGQNSLLGAFSSFISPLGQGAKPGSLRSIQLRAEAVGLPGRNIETQPDNNVYGPIRNVASGVNFAEDLNITFQCGSELQERKFFENWQTTIYDVETWNMNYYNEYIGSISIFLLDRQDKRRYGLKCLEVFPKTVGSIELGHSLNSSYATCQVGFVFRNWEPLDIARQKKNILGNVKETVIDHVERNILKNIPSVLKKLF
ncbi:uncharacterized protein METZ01_LOCUS52571 [marine metagenome]|uniref:Uncharacterized protein n=1 Tax=marine metagenome TaxID=408172 RepID=A0A381SBV3_9ZZZZ